jgi:hypothetical protein
MCSLVFLRFAAGNLFYICSLCSNLILSVFLRIAEGSPSVYMCIWNRMVSEQKFVPEVPSQTTTHLRHVRYLREHRTLVFEKSPSYMDLADPRDVARLLPRAKFIFLSRDPVPRLMSAYYQYCETYEGLERQGTWDIWLEYPVIFTIFYGYLSLDKPLFFCYQIVFFSSALPKFRLIQTKYSHMVYLMLLCVLGNLLSSFFVILDNQYFETYDSQQRQGVLFCFVISFLRINLTGLSIDLKYHYIEHVHSYISWHFACYRHSIMVWSDKGRGLFCEFLYVYVV